jgi:hypothetical protein
MANLRIISTRNEDNSTRFIVDVPARRNGQVNFGVVEKINQVLLLINPQAFDPPDPPPLTTAIRDGHTADGGGLVEAMLDRAAEEPDGLKAGEAYRGEA